jgi:excinuclease ABC subunit C
MEKQKIDTFSENDFDVIGVVKVLDRARIEVFSVRNRRMQKGENFIFKDISSEKEAELLESFIMQYYTEGNVPQKIMFKYELPSQELIKEWLTKLSGRKSIEIKIPKIGEKMRFIEMAEKNAEIALQNRTTAMDDEEILMDLMELLNLDELPRRIESYDISNISGTDQVAGMVVFENAKPKKNEYRRLKIKEVEGQNDVASLREVLERRLKYIVNTDESVKNPFGPKPNLILMDGGITQIRSAKSVIDDYGLDIQVFGMVKTDKHRTRAILDENGKEYDISKNQKLFNFVTFMQDEVHDTAITYHRKLRDEKVRKSALDNIEGIGEKRKKDLLLKFKSIDKMKDASIKELCEVKGITPEIAERIKNL